MKKKTKRFVYYDSRHDKVYIITNANNKTQAWEELKKAATNDWYCLLHPNAFSADETEQMLEHNIREVEEVVEL
jgi:hypothetical protein